MNFSREVSTADVGISTSNSSSGCDISENIRLFRNTRKIEERWYQKKEELNSDPFRINEKPYLIGKNEIKRKVEEIITNSVEKSILIESRRLNFGKYFHFWKLQKHFSSMSLSKVHSSTYDRTINDGQMSEEFVKKRLNMMKGSRKKTKNCVIKHKSFLNNSISGSPKKIFPFHSYFDRFGIPNTMMYKARKKQQINKIEKAILKKVRLSYLGYNQPPSKDESSDNDSIENIKKLALFRTPYFLIPTIKMNGVQRKDRFQNKYLKNYRLNRINVLLYENQRPDSKLNESGNPTLDLESSARKPNILKVSQRKEDNTMLCSNIGSKCREVQRPEKFHVTIQFLIKF